MDIYSAESHVKKLLEYVQQLADTQPRMYEKSRERLRELASTCKEVVKVISDVLQEEALQADQSEFGRSNDVADMLESMQGQLRELQSFVGSPAIPSSKLSSSAKRRAFRDYQTALCDLSNAEISNTYASDCAKLLWRWFHTRFVNNKSSQFRYNIARFPNWVRDIVIAYGKAVADDAVLQFEAEFSGWIDEIPASNIMFAVPKDIYSINSNPKPEDMSLEAVVIWDMLLDAGLSDLCVDAGSGLYPTSDCVYKMCGDLAPNLLDDYTRYSEDETVLTKCKLSQEVV